MTRDETLQSFVDHGVNIFGARVAQPEVRKAVRELLAERNTLAATVDTLREALQAWLAWCADSGTGSFFKPLDLTTTALLTIPPVEGVVPLTPPLE